MSTIFTKLFEANKDKLFATVKENLKKDGKDFMVISFDENESLQFNSFSFEEKKVVKTDKVNWMLNEINSLRNERQILRIEVNKLRSEINHPLIDWTKENAINQIS